VGGILYSGAVAVVVGGTVRVGGVEGRLMISSCTFFFVFVRSNQKKVHLVLKIFLGLLNPTIIVLLILLLQLSLL